MTELKESSPPPDVSLPKEPAPPEAAAPAKRGLAWLGLIVLVATAIIGSNMFSVRDRLFGSAIPEPAAPAASRDAFQSVPTQSSAPTKLRSEPWWQDVASLRGTGTATTTQFTIDKSAIQWRARAGCESGRLVARAPGQAKPIVDTSCPPGAVGEGTGDGPMRVDVEAEGPWRLKVQQQIDAPLVEPPLTAMTAPGARKLATGTFYKVAKTGTGTVTMFRQPDGRTSLRLQRFFVSPTSDLEVRLSTSRTPRTSRDYVRSRSVRVAIMDVTAGSLNYTAPAGIDPSDFHSVVIWCAATREAYAAASLKVVR